MIEHGGKYAIIKESHHNMDWLDWAVFYIPANTV